MVNKNTLREIGKIICCMFMLLLASAIGGCGGGGDDSGSNGTGGPSCGGNSQNVCGPNQFCKYTDFTCGQTGLPGVCTDIPLDCNAPTVTGLQGTVCSCDNLDFHSECWAEQAGQSLRGAGACP